MELKNREERFRDQKLRTLYFGGGTPSIVPADTLEDLIGQIESVWGLSGLEEWTFEANPDDLEPELLRRWKDWGVDRLSLGIQSFEPEILQWMNRAHSARQSLQAIDRVRSEGFERFSLDLIYGLPENLPDRWESDLLRALSYKPEHLSAYALTVEPRTALDHSIRRFENPAPTEDRVVRDYHILCERMAEAGYEHYELSNFALPGFRAKHNSAYWSGSDYLGLGPSAHSAQGDLRWSNISNNALYIKRIEEGLELGEQESLGERELYNERIMTGLRSASGICRDWADALEPKLAKRVRDQWNRAIDSGRLLPLDSQAGQWRIPEREWLTTDALCRLLFA
jgi:oxygen-independent coproporphyrinogen-3 oxidase